MTAEAIPTIGPDDRRSPLHDWAGRLRAGSRDGVVALRELPFLTQIGLRVGEEAADVRDACGEAVGLAIPLEAGHATGSAVRSVLWLGPDEWLVVAGPGEERELLGGLAAAVEGAHASVVDLSANRAVLELSGSRARDVLEAGCRIDLHPRAFGPSSCVVTELARATVYLHQLDAVRYRLFVRGSFAAYLAEWLLDAMVEHTAPVDTR